MALVLHDHSLPHCSLPPEKANRTRSRRSARAGRRALPTTPTAAKYVRRRILVGCSVVVVGVAVLMTANSALHATTAHLAPFAPGGGFGERPGPVLVERTIRPGDTLWGLAESLPGGGDIRAKVDELARLNGGSLLRAGDVVKIPAAWVGKR